MTASRAKWCSFLLSNVCLAAAFGCESPKSEPGSRATIDAGDDPSALPSTLPGGYTTRMACGDIGKICSASCPEGLLCSAGACVPAHDDGALLRCPDGLCPEATPICALGSCVTVDELACLCANDASRPLCPQCDSLDENAGAGQCIAADALCDVRPDGCCEGLSCLQGKDDEGLSLLGLCKSPCSQHDDCDSKCCISGQGIAAAFCADTAACVTECRKLEDSCDGARNPCCEGLVCTQGMGDGAPGGCQKPCERDVECDSGCCLLFVGADHGVCAPAERCD
jgi:hypothetical protein